MPVQAEAEYYEQLYRIAVPEGGDIAGGAAVMFFMKSGLPKPTLSEIWNTSNLRRATALNKHEFFIAMRLTAIAQSGNAVSRDAVLSASAPALPRFVGIPAPGAPAPAAPAPAPAPALGGASPYMITPADQTKYDLIFGTNDTDGDGYLLAGQAVELFTKSGLDRGTLKAIWTLSDMDKDGRLDKGEFSVAMHLVVGASKRGVPVPSTLPLELLQARSRRGSTPAPPVAVAVAPVAAPAPPPASFIPTRIDDAFGSVVVAEPAPAPAPPPAPAPVIVSAPAPAPLVPAPAPVAFNQAASGIGMGQRRPSGQSGGGSFGSAPFQMSASASAVPPPAPPAHAPSGSTLVHHTPSFSTSSGSAGSVSLGQEEAAALVKPLGAAASEVETAMSSHVRRENISLEARRALTEAAGVELKRLEQERAVFVGQLDKLRNAAEAEDREYADMLTKAGALRAELAQLRAAEAQAQQGVAARRGRNAEAKGALAALAVQLVTLGGRKDALSAEAAALLEAAHGTELASVQAALQASQLQGVALAHNTAAELNEEDTAALQAAVAATHARIRELEVQVQQGLAPRVKAADASAAAAQAQLSRAEGELHQAQARHATR